ncbi:MAG: DegQ family serine endoprotease [Verrucomicrobiota bacterium]
MKTWMMKWMAAGALALAGGTTLYLSAGNAFGGAPAIKLAKAEVNVSVNDHPLTRDSRPTSSFASVVKKTAPSVVNIFTTKKVRNELAMGGNPMFEDPMFQQFFGRPFGQNPQQPKTHTQRSLGSGVIVTEDGYILTNNHVVDGADEIRVMLEKDRREYTAKVVGRDPKTDLAVLRIEAKGLSYATFGNSDNLEVGDIVLAIGNPFGIGQTVTSGIISAMGRGGMGIEEYEDFIQTDASINPGNSGGALIDAEGRLIGINTAILSRSGGNHGVGFAVPCNLARQVMEQLIEFGKVERGFLGVAIQDLTPELAKQFSLNDAKGALVGEVTANSAAAEAGLKDGDIITGINGKEVRDSRHLRLTVAQLKPGNKVELKLMRDGKEKTVKATLKTLPEARVAAASQPNGSTPGEALDGVAVTDLSPALRQQFKLPPALKGALITDVAPNSASFEAGLRPGMVLQEINRKSVTSAEDAVNLTKNVKEKQTLVRLWANGGSRYIVVDETKVS